MCNIINVFYDFLSLDILDVEKQEKKAVAGIFENSYVIPKPKSTTYK